MGLVATATCFAVAVAGLATAVLMTLDGTQFQSMPRLAVYGVLPVFAALAATVALRAGDAARKVFLAHGLAIAAALLGAEAWLSENGNAAAPAADPRQPAGGTKAARAYPHVCGASLDIVTPPLRVEGRPVIPLGGLPDNLLNPADPPDKWRRTDKYGFNNPPGQWSPPAALMVVGDSYSFGEDVPIGRGFVDRLRERFGTVVNLGCGGNGPLLTLASLVEYGPLARPKVVVWAFYEGNDLTSDLLLEMRSPILMKYLAGEFSQHLVRSREAIAAALGAHLDQALPSSGAAAPSAAPSRCDALIRLAALRQLRSALGLAHRIGPEPVATLRRVIATARDAAARWGGQLVFAHLPVRSRYQSLLGNLDADAYAQPVRRMVESLGIAFIDVPAAFARHHDPRSLSRGHYTQEGYALVADTIGAALAPTLKKVN